MDTSATIALLRTRLTAALDPQRLEIVDESQQHVGHPGARGGGGHFRVVVVSSAFEGKSLLERHRMVYAAVGEAMHREVHALSISALTPTEGP
jgi:BolA protein